MKTLVLCDDSGPKWQNQLEMTLSDRSDSTIVEKDWS
jgi:hypothetical protein